MKQYKIMIGRALLFFALVGISFSYGCGSEENASDSSGDSETEGYSLTLSVSGVYKGAHVTIATGGQTHSITGDGLTTLASQQVSGASFSLSIDEKPVNQTCSLSESSATLNDANVTIDLTCSSSFILFRATDGTDTNLYKTDGTADGTEVLLSDNSGTKGVIEVASLDGNLYFAGDDGTNGVELWVSDGTTLGTSMLKNIKSGSGDSDPKQFITVGDKIYFSARGDSGGIELWASDGTSSGTSMLKDINNSGNSYPYDLVALNNKLYFRASDGSNGAELWVSDGTSTGTYMVKDIEPGGGSSPGYLTALNGKLYFSANKEIYDEEDDKWLANIELWVSDGTESGTEILKDIHASGESDPSYLTVFENKLYFSAETAGDGGELWVSDGTSSGTSLVKDINIGSDSSWPDNFVSINGNIFFSANDGTQGIELWVSDGTASGTGLLKDINSGAASSIPVYLTEVNGKVFFRATTGDEGREPWVSDGTAAGTKLLLDINSGTGNSM